MNKEEISRRLAIAAARLKHAPTDDEGRRPDGTYLPTIPEAQVESVRASEIAWKEESGMSRHQVWAIRKGTRRKR